MSAEPSGAAPVCRWCGTPLPVRTGRGRPGRYCGTTCRVNAHRAARRAETDPAVRTTANALARQLTAAGRELAAAAIGHTPDLAAEAAARRLVDQLAALARQAAVTAPPAARNETSTPVTKTVEVEPTGPTADTMAAPPSPERNENPETATETGEAGVGDSVDRDELFDALEDLMALDRSGLPAELAEALTLPIVCLASALAGASGDGPVDELVTAGRDVVDAVTDYRQMPAAAGVVRMADRLAAALPAPTTGRNENRERNENLARRPDASGQSAPAEPAPPVDDDTAAYDREQAEQRRRFEAALKPVPGLDGVLMAEWPGTGCYYLVEASTGERIGYAEKKAFTSRWEARTMRGSKVPATTTYGTRREALVQVALHHQEITQRTRRTGRSGHRRGARPGEDTGEDYDLVRSPDYDATGAWQVLADGARVGQVRPLHRPTGGKAWTAHGPSGVAITIGAGKDGGYRTRTAAAVQVLITHRINERTTQKTRR